MQHVQPQRLALLLTFPPNPDGLGRRRACAALDCRAAKQVVGCLEAVVVQRLVGRDGGLVGLGVLGSPVDELPEQTLQLVGLVLSQELAVRPKDGAVAVSKAVQARARKVRQRHDGVFRRAVDPIRPTARREPHTDTLHRESGQTHRSIGVPRWSLVHTRPPMRSRASNTATLNPLSSSTWAARSPATPAPTMPTSGAAAVVVVLDVGVFDDGDGPLAESMLV